MKLFKINNNIFQGYKFRMNHKGVYLKNMIIKLEPILQCQSLFTDG